MPLPLVFIGIAAATGLFGIGKAVKAVADTKKAKKVTVSANSIIETNKRKLEGARSYTYANLEKLGRTKLFVLKDCVQDFVDTFSHIKNIDFKSSVGLDELQKLHIDHADLKELKEMGTFATSVLSGITGGVLGGAVAAFGAYSAAGTFAAASTGTAIATLNGIAATNATLAFFGGGSLAVGGLGMAGGMMVLGGLVAGPALAIMGVIVGAKANTEKNKAYENLATAKKCAKEMQLASDMCYSIGERSDMFTEALARLQDYATPLIKEMKSAVTQHNGDYNEFSEGQKKTTAACVAIIKSIKTIIDTPIITKNGKLTKDSERVLQEINIPK